MAPCQMTSLNFRFLCLESVENNKCPGDPRNLEWGLKHNNLGQNVSESLFIKSQHSQPSGRNPGPCGSSPLSFPSKLNHLSASRCVEWETGVYGGKEHVFWSQTYSCHPFTHLSNPHFKKYTFPSAFYGPSPVLRNGIPALLLHII